MTVNFENGKVRYSFVTIPEGSREKEARARNLKADPTILNRDTRRRTSLHRGFDGTWKMGEEIRERRKTA